MQLVFDPAALEDLAYWIKTDRRTALRVLSLVESTLDTPFEGIGKPEPLKHQLSGAWSRRINREHRLVYRVRGEGDDQQLVVLACRYHYGG